MQLESKRSDHVEGNSIKVGDSLLALHFVLNMKKINFIFQGFVFQHWRFVLVLQNSPSTFIHGISSWEFYWCFKISLVLISRIFLPREFWLVLHNGDFDQCD